MNGLSTQGSLELEVTNFGPIINAKVDLRPLTVFVGPSNTGKSYMAILIYALHRYFCGHDVKHMGFSRGIHMKVGKQSKKTIEELAEWVEPFSKDPQKWTNVKQVALPDLVANEIQSGFKFHVYGLCIEICRCFGINSIQGLAHKGSKHDTGIFLSRRLGESTLIEHKLTFKAQKKTKFNTTIPNDTSVLVDIEDIIRSGYFHHLSTRLLLGAETSDSNLEFLAMRLIEDLDSLSKPHLVGPLFLPAYYLPSDRTGVMHAHSAVVRALIENAAMAALRPTPRTPLLSGVLADFLEQLIEIDPLAHRTPDLSKQIEKSILGGSVHIDKSGDIGYPSFTYRPKGWKNNLPLMNTSSMVSELAPVVLYLRYMITSDDVLIIEEPESHLHPAMQVEFTRQIAMLIHSGIRVLITTHSEWVLEELANILRRSEIPGDHGEDLANTPVVLHSDQVGAWLFEPQGPYKGSVVKEISLDESGLYPSGIDEVAIALHNDWADITRQLGDSG